MTVQPLNRDNRNIGPYHEYMDARKQIYLLQREGRFVFSPGQMVTHENPEYWSAGNDDVEEHVKAIVLRVKSCQYDWLADRLDRTKTIYECLPVGSVETFCAPATEFVEAWHEEGTSETSYSAPVWKSRL